MRTPEEQANFELLCQIENLVSVLINTHGYGSLTEPQKTIYAVWWLDADVNNGGFDQYFFNSWSDHYADALHGLDLIGAPQTAAILRRAIAVFPDTGPSTDREQRVAELAGLSEAVHNQFHSLTNEFYERPHDLEALLAAYARRHIAELSS